MIRESDISTALGQRLKGVIPMREAARGGSHVPRIAWPNQKVTLERPYLFVQVVRVSRTDPTVEATFPISNGQFVVTVVSDLDAFAVDAENYADDVAAHFPMGLRIPVAGGQITIMQPPEVLQGFPDKVSWRVPVRITYRAME